MSRWLSYAVGLIGLLLGTLASAQSENNLPLLERVDVDVSGDDGLIFLTRDGQSFVRLGGRFQFDFDFFDGAYNAQGNGSASENEIRRARLGVDGRFEGQWHYSFIINIDDREESSTIDTALVEYRFADRDLVLSGGRFKRPVGLEPLTSSKWISTIERAFIFDLIPANNTADAGVMVSGGVGPLRAFFGFFDAGVEDLATRRDEYGVYGRLAAAWVGEQSLIHVGLSAADQQAKPRTLTAVSSRLGVHTLDFDQFQLINELTPERERSALLSINGDRQAGVELAARYRFLSLQAEWLKRELDLDFGAPVRIAGGYLQLTYTLTGEPRRYRVEEAVFDRIQPTHDWGAWELVAKIEQSSARQAEQPKPSATVLTLGLNWQPNARIRLMLNYLRHNSDNLASGNAFNERGSAVTSRLQFQF